MAERRKALVEADKAGIKQWSSPAERKRQETAIERRRVLFCDYVMEEFAPTWLEYAADGSKLAAGSQRKHREYLNHLSQAFFWKYPLTGITTEDVNRWLANLENFGGATPRKKNIPTTQSRLRQGSSRGGRTQIPSQYESPGSAQIATSPNTPSNSRRASNHLREYAQNHTNSRMVRSHTRFTNR